MGLNLKVLSEKKETKVDAHISVNFSHFLTNFVSVKRVNFHTLVSRIIVQAHISVMGTRSPVYKKRSKNVYSFDFEFVYSLFTYFNFNCG